MGFLALGHSDTPRSEYFKSRRGGDGESPMGAVHKAGAFDNQRAGNAGLAQQFETDCGPDDVHNGIDRAHFMEMDRFRG